MKFEFSQEEMNILEQYASKLMENPCRKCSVKDRAICNGCPELYDYDKDLAESGLKEKYNNIGAESFIPINLENFKNEIVEAFISVAELRREFSSIKGKLDKAEDKLNKILGSTK